jgi:CHAT domain-containing protein
VLRGDEPLGLVRAFLLAGARAVLVTLWPVEDISARLLMERLYTELAAQPRPDPAAALRAAQRYLRSLSPAELAARLRAWNVEPPAGLDCADPAIWAAYAVIGGV